MLLLYKTKQYPYLLPVNHTTPDMLKISHPDMLGVSTSIGGRSPQALFYALILKYGFAVPVTGGVSSPLNQSPKHLIKGKESPFELVSSVCAYPTVSLEKDSPYLAPAYARRIGHQ